MAQARPTGCLPSREMGQEQVVSWSGGIPRLDPTTVMGLLHVSVFLHPSSIVETLGGRLLSHGLKACSPVLIQPAGGGGWPPPSFIISLRLFAPYNGGRQFFSVATVNTQLRSHMDPVHFPPFLCFGHPQTYLGRKFQSGNGIFACLHSPR